MPRTLQGRKQWRVGDVLHNAAANISYQKTIQKYHEPLSLDLCLWPNILPVK